jgi:hypothetical protein
METVYKTVIKTEGVSFIKFINICARVVNLVTYDVVDDQKQIFVV